MDREKLEEIVSEHLLFLRSNGDEGRKAILNDADLRGAHLEKADLQKANLSSANLSDAGLAGAILNNVKLNNADLRGANLEGASLISADLTDADLTDANLANTILRGAILTSAQINNANLSKSDLTNAEINSADIISANLTGANLSNADLSSVNLEGSILRGAVLSNAEIIDAILRNTDFTDSDLTNSDLSNSNLNNSDLSNAVLKNANLGSADLSNVNLCDADLRNADLSGTILFGVLFRNTVLASSVMDEKTIIGSSIFANVDLGTVQSISSAVHVSPSTIGVDTIIKSGGKIDNRFLINSGSQKFVVDYFNSYMYNPIHKLTCFISYADEDEEFVHKLIEDLNEKKVRTWSVPEDLKIDDKIRELILNSLAEYDSVIIVLSEHSVKRHWIEKEVTGIMDRLKEGRPNILFPVRLDDTLYREDEKWIDEIRGIVDIGDFTDWSNQQEYTKSFEQLLADITGARK